MLAGQVLPDHAERPCAGRIAPRGFQEGVPGRARRAPKRLDEEFLFRVEMVVETADREPRPLHNVHHRACFDTPLAKERGGRSGDRFTGLLFLLGFLIHVVTSRRTAPTMPPGESSGRMRARIASVGVVFMANACLAFARCSLWRSEGLRRRARLPCRRGKGSGSGFP